MLSETAFQALIKVTREVTPREVTPTGKQLRIHYKQSIILSENPFLTALNAINSINSISNTKQN